MLQAEVVELHVPVEHVRNGGEAEAVDARGEAVGEQQRDVGLGRGGGVPDGVLLRHCL